MGILEIFFLLSPFKAEVINAAISTMPTTCSKLADRASSTIRSKWVSVLSHDMLTRTLSVIRVQMMYWSTVLEIKRLQDVCTVWHMI